MERLTNGQRRALDALIRTLGPPGLDEHTADRLAEAVLLRLADTPTFHQRLAGLVLRLFDSTSFSFLVSGRPVAFSRMHEAGRARLLARCAEHRLRHVRLIYSSMRRLILHTHYALAGEVEPSRAERLAGPSRVSFSAGIAANTPALTTRVCVIGSGVGGAMAACVLAEAGHDVVIVETGVHHKRPFFGDDELAAMRGLYADGGL